MDKLELLEESAKHMIAPITQIDLEKVDMKLQSLSKEEVNRLLDEYVVKN